VRPAEKSLSIYRDTAFQQQQAPVQNPRRGLVVALGAGEDLRRGLLLPGKPKGVVIAAGAYMPEKEQLAPSATGCWKSRLIQKIIQKPAVHKIFRELKAKRCPGAERVSLRASGDRPDQAKAMGPEHHAARGISARSNFAQTVIKHFKLLAAMVDALNTPIAHPRAQEKVLSAELAGIRVSA